jgi:beta-phosphoglucomutase-like phosphatase (HAD superfamily)
VPVRPFPGGTVRAMAPPLSPTVIFDLDGMLIDSEPRWEAAEQQVFAALGVNLDATDTASTTGLRVDEVVGHWLARRPWDCAAPGASVEEVALAIVDAMVGHALTDPIEGPGAGAAVDRLAAAGLRLAVCSSSPARLIEASLTGLGLADRFEVTHSAEGEPAGKPHPACYLSTAAMLGVAPRACVAIEDSVNGAIAAAAAGMAVVAVPAPGQADDPRFDFCHRVLPGFERVDAKLISAVVAGR